MTRKRNLKKNPRKVMRNLPSTLIIRVSLPKVLKLISQIFFYKPTE